MNNDELLAILKPYEGRVCRISSDASHVAWRANEWPQIEAVYVNPVGEVWVRAADGASWLVTGDGLTIELEPAVGTYDYAAGVDQMRAVGTVLRLYEADAEATAAPGEAWVEDDRGITKPRPTDPPREGGPNLGGF